MFTQVILIEIYTTALGFIAKGFVVSVSYRKGEK